MTEVLIRPATPNDSALIVHYVRALAAYEKEPVEQVKLTEEAVRRDGFGARPLFEVLIAELDGAPAGFALFFTNYSTWEGNPGIYVEDLFVEEHARKASIGRQLLAAVANLGRERGCVRIDLAVLDWNPARQFYHRLGFHHASQWQIWRLSGAALARLADEGE